MQGMVPWRQMGLTEALSEAYEKFKKFILIMVAKGLRQCQTECNHSLFSLKV